MGGRLSGAGNKFLTGMSRSSGKDIDENACEIELGTGWFVYANVAPWADDSPGSLLREIGGVTIGIR